MNIIKKRLIRKFAKENFDVPKDVVADIMNDYCGYHGSNFVTYLQHRLEDYLRETGLTGTQWYSDEIVNRLKSNDKRIDEAKLKLEKMIIEKTLYAFQESPTKEKLFNKIIDKVGNATIEQVKEWADNLTYDKLKNLFQPDFDAAFNSVIDYYESMYK